MKTPFTLYKRATTAFVAAALSLAAIPAAAEDVDIFTAGGGVTSKPNVLIVLDSSSNWSASLGANTCNTGNMADNTKFAAEICALRLVADAIASDPVASVRFGLMMFAETGTNGGYVRFGIRDMDFATRDSFKNMLANFVPNSTGTDNSSSSQPLGKTMFEVFKYFGGGDGTGTQSATQFGPIAFAGGASNPVGAKRRDYNGNNSGSATGATANRAAMKYGAGAPFPLSGSATDTYTNGITDNCAKNFVIFIANGNPGTGGDSGSPTADALLTNIGGDATAAGRIKSGGTEIHASLFDEYAKYLYTHDVSPLSGNQRIITYTIAVYEPNASTGAISTTDQNMIKLMKSAAAVGGGKYFAATNAADVVNALLTILNEVQAVNSVFVSASLPVSVNTQGTFLNQVYMGLFRPDGSGSPRWLGNVKEYKFIQDSGTGDIFLSDSTGARAVNPATGFLSPGAVSFWTSSSTFWTNNQSGTPLSASDSPDGEVVEKGGASEVIRKAYLTDQTSRRVYTCPLVGSCGGPDPGTPISGNPFTTATINGAAFQTAFGASATELPMLVNWIRGQDNQSGATPALPNGLAPCDTANAACLWTSPEAGPGWNTTVRPSIHGDVLHSRPVVLNYESGGPYVFYGANDGTLRALKGGTTAADGTERWAFVAPEFYSKFKRQRLGTPELRTPGTAVAMIPFTLPKDYFFDGPIGSWEDFSTTPTTRWIFVTARRGGAVLYAFDVTDPDTPKFKWKKTAAELGNLGQTWSLPVAFKIPYNGTGDPFLVFGAGYDPGEDNSPATSTSKGRGIYVLNANNGNELAFINSTAGGLTIQSPIASDMGFLAKPLAAGGFGDVYRGYVGDMDGYVWRLDIPSGTVADWKLHRFADLGRGYKFLYAPDLVRAGDRDMVLIGSGDREKPLLTTTGDRFWGLADKQNLDTPAASVTAIVTGDLQLLAGNSNSTCTTCLGWYRDLAAGEKVVNSPLTVAGITFFATNKPTPPAVGSCATNLGEAKAYGLSFLGGGLPNGKSSISTTLTGGGLPPSPVGGVVELEPGKLVTFVIGTGAGGSPIEPTRPPLTVPLNRSKIYWNTKTDG